MATQQHEAERRSFRGRTLVASPFADNSPYRRSIVHLLQHDARGAFGVILDGSFSESLAQLREQLPRIASMQQGTASVLALPVKVAMWAPGQLDHELQSGVWFNTGTNPQEMLDHGVPPWHTLVREVGRSVYRDALGIDEFPSDVWMN